jgi:hypothetical protein
MAWLGWTLLLAPLVLGATTRASHGRPRRVLFHATVVSVMLLVFAALWVLPLGGTEGSLR